MRAVAAPLLLGKIAVAHITLLKKLSEFRYLSIPQPLERGNITNGITNAKQILKQRPPHSITKRAR
jgi:hypothetical protein